MCVLYVSYRVSCVACCVVLKCPGERDTFRFALDTYVFGPYVYPVIEEWSLAKYFYIKDSCKVDNLLKWEWEECRKRGGAARKKTKSAIVPKEKTKKTR